MIEYYTGRDASLMSENEMALKLAHLSRIRKMEKEDQLINHLNNLFGEQQRT